jgi:hypothetical protein
MLAASNVVKMTTNFNRNCYITNQSYAFCKGGSDTGKLFAPASVDISLSDMGTFCSAMGDGRLACSGPYAGQPGDVNFGVSHAFPAMVSSITNAVHVVAGGGDTCALGKDGSASCWGLNFQGASGSGTIDPAATPVTLPFTNATQLVVGAEHACALLSDQRVLCWGGNEYGQISSPAGPPKFAPVEVQLQ